MEFSDGAGAESALFIGKAYTALHLAACCGQAQTCRVLVQGSLPCVPVGGDERRTPLMLAAVQGHKEACAVLREAEKAQNNRRNSLILATAGYARCDLEVVRALLDPNAAGLDPNWTDSMGFTAAHFAALSMISDVVPLLVARGADLNRRCRVPVETSPYDSLPMVAQLVAHGATVSDDFITKVTNRTKKMKAKPPTRVLDARRTLFNAAMAMKDFPEAERDPDRFLHLLVNGKREHGHAKKIREIIQARAWRARKSCMVRFRRSHEAERDAGMVFEAAAEGRPMELARRLRLGKLAGGLEIKGEMEDGAGGTRVVGPLEAARLGGHDECVRVLEEAMG